LIAITIAASTVVLALDKYPISDEELLTIEYWNIAFQVVFVIELVVKLFGLGFKSYFFDFSNSFDFFVVIVSEIDIIIAFML
jgi:hypothetical protein